MQFLDQIPEAVATTVLLNSYRGLYACFYNSVPHIFLFCEKLLSNDKLSDLNKMFKRYMLELSRDSPTAGVATLPYMSSSSHWASG
jgi:hypothetical protein